MTNTAKYRNVSLDHETYNLLLKQSKKICDVDLSVSQTVKHNANITQQMLDSPQYISPLRGSKTYQAWKKKLLAKFLPVVIQQPKDKHAGNN